MSPARYVCIHGHWYQPPRENPFTGAVDDQPSAAPFLNWNERITAESYAPNCNALILAPDGSEEQRINNYEWISSDWGATLLDWIEANAPDTYRQIVEADRASRQRFGGHGSAMAHAYNHTILPLSNRRDKRTQIIWGIADFRKRFGRDPEGIWLPETAVDLESLDLMAEAGIGFTILSPYQASEVEGATGWADATGGKIDSSVPYRVELPTGREIAVFFYDGPLSQEVAFAGLLEDGEELARRLIAAVDGHDGEPRLSHIATDGETYGHHHRHGEMALAKAITVIADREDVAMTNYAQFLEIRRPQRRVRIQEETSWSCAHGVERWRSDCGCSAGRLPDSNQRWRTELRLALDHLRDSLAALFESTGGEVLVDPWAARDEYIEVVLGRPFDQFFEVHRTNGVDESQRSRAQALLEIQRRAMLMYTSCGWFFDDVGGLESVFVLRQAGRAIDLTRSVFGVDYEPEFLELLEQAVSNRPDTTGRDVYLASVSPYVESAVR